MRRLVGISAVLVPVMALLVVGASALGARTGPPPALALAEPHGAGFCWGGICPGETTVLEAAANVGSGARQLDQLIPAYTGLFNADQVGMSLGAGQVIGRMSISGFNEPVALGEFVAHFGPPERVRVMGELFFRYRSRGLYVNVRGIGCNSTMPFLWRVAITGVYIYEPGTGHAWMDTTPWRGFSLRRYCES